MPERSREFRFFIPTQHVPHDPKNWAHVSEAERAKVIAQYGNLEKADKSYALQDFRRMEGLNDGHWSFIGIIAKAEIVTPSNIVQVIRSVGLWGVESDSDSAYLKSVEDEELAQLKTELESLGNGFGKRAIEYAFKNAERS